MSSKPVQTALQAVSSAWKQTKGSVVAAGKAYIVRWFMTDPRMMNLPESFINDAVCIETARYCDHFIEDDSRQDKVLLPQSEQGQAGTAYRLYKPTSILSALMIRAIMFQEESLLRQAHAHEIDYDFYEPLDPATWSGVAQKNYCKRYDLNVALTEQQQAIDVLYDILYSAFGGYHTYGADARVEIRCRKPADRTFLREPLASGATEIPVDSIMAWRNSLRGKILVGANLLTSEARTVTGTRFSLAGNTIELSASGGVTASGGTLTGCDGDQIPATATLTVSDSTGLKSVTIGSVTVIHSSQAADTTASVAVMLAGMINADSQLTNYIKAEWNESAPAQVKLAAKFGSLQLSSPLEYVHDIDEEILRVAAVFTSGAKRYADLTCSNILKDSFKFPGGQRQTSYNVIDFMFRDSSVDFKRTRLRVKDKLHIAQVGKELRKEINGAAVGGYNQARRRANHILAELRDGDFFTQHTADGEALLLDVGEVIAISHDAGEFINLPVSIENAQYTSDITVNFGCRRYLSSMFADYIEARQVPIPTIYQTASVPTLPRDLRAVLGNESVSLSWTRPARGYSSTGTYRVTVGTARDAQGLITLILDGYDNRQVDQATLTLAIPENASVLEVDVRSENAQGMGGAATLTINLQKETAAPTLAQIGASTPDEITLRVEGFTGYARRRRVRIATNEAMTTDLVERISLLTIVGIPLPNVDVIERNTTNAEPQNVALSSAGATASASTTQQNGDFAPSNAINGVRYSSANGQGMAEGNAMPYTLTVTFAAAKTINRIVLYGVRDDYATQSDPDDTTPSTLYGIADFTLELEVGGVWTNVATATGNALARRQFDFTEQSATGARCVVTLAQDATNTPRIVELEAYATDQTAALAQAIWVRVSHSSATAGDAWSPESAAQMFSFADASGTGGTSGDADEIPRNRYHYDYEEPIP